MLATKGVQVTIVDVTRTPSTSRGAVSTCRTTCDVNWQMAGISCATTPTAMTPL